MQYSHYPTPQFLFYISLSFALCVPSPNFFVFCGVGVLSKKNRLLVLHRTSYTVILPYRLHLSSYLFLSDIKNIISPVNLYLCIMWNDIFTNQIRVTVRGPVRAPFLSSDVTVAILLWHFGSPSHMPPISIEMSGSTFRTDLLECVLFNLGYW
jgi:hypothetical protein